MKQKMTKLLSVALLIAMVLSLCVPAAFADGETLPDKPDLDGGVLTSANWTTTSDKNTFTIDIEALGLTPYNPSFEVTSATPWISVDSSGLVTASHSGITHEAENTLRAVKTKTDEVTVSYSKGEGESKVTKTFKVSFTVNDNDAVAVNSALDALSAAASTGGKDGLLNLLKHVAQTYYPLGELSVRDEVLVKKQGASKEALMDLICNASGLSGVIDGGYVTDGLKVNFGEFVGTLVYGKPEECKVESNAEIAEQTNRQNEIDTEHNRLTAAATGGTEHEKLQGVLKAMAEKNYTVDDAITDVDELLFQKKGSYGAIQSLLGRYVSSECITGVTSDSNGLIVRLTESDVKYIGTMVSGNAAATFVEAESVPTRDAGTLTVTSSGKGMPIPEGASTEYQIDLTGLNGVSYEYEDGSWVTVAEDGKMTPKEHSFTLDTDGAHAVESHEENVTVKYGEKSFKVHVSVVDVYAQQYNDALDALYAAINSGSNPREKVEKALKYAEENFSNDPTVFGREDIIMTKKGSGQGTQDLLVSVLKECGVPVKPGAVDDHILRIYVTDGNDNYEGSLTFTDPRTSKVEQKDFSVNGSAIVGYLSNAAVLAFPETVNGYAITTLGQPGETFGEFWNGNTVKEITIPASITTVYPTIFKGYNSLKTITVDAGNANYSSKDGALYSKDGSKLIAIPALGAAAALPSGIKTIGADAIPGGLYNSIVVPQGTTTLENNAIGGCYILFIPDSVTTISKTAFSNVTDVVVVKGSAAETFCNDNGISCHSVTKEEYSSYASKVTPGTSYLIAVQPQDRTAAVDAEVTFTADILGNHPTLGWQYSADGKTWKEVVSGVNGYTVTNGELKFKVAQDLDGYKYRVVAGEIVTNAATLTVAENLGESETLMLGDKGYDMSRLAAKVNGAEMCRNGVGVSPASSVKLANGETALFTTATYKWDSDVHKRYPVGMQVWALTNKDGAYTMTHLSELDNLLRYSGSSIRVTGKKGIRMITSISEDLRNKLINTGVGGFTLREYGTCVAWDSALGGAYPVLGNSKSAYAYKRGAADPIFARGGGLISYTNVLVGFTNDQCKPDMSMRPYAVLADKSGNTYTVYGGTVHRSIGYIALQNKDAFKSGTDAYNYIWDIIHTVYGKDYKG